MLTDNQNWYLRVQCDRSRVEKDFEVSPENMLIGNFQEIFRKNMKEQKTPPYPCQILNYQIHQMIEQIIQEAEPTVGERPFYHGSLEIETEMLCYRSAPNLAEVCIRFKHHSSQTGSSENQQMEEN